MSEYTIDAETAATTIAAGDEWDIFQASTGRIKKVTAAQVAAYTGNSSIVESFTALTTVGAGTLTAANIVGRATNRTGSTAAFTDTTDTAALIFAAMTGAIAGMAFEYTYYNNTLGIATITGGTGVTVTAGSITNALVPPACWARFLVTLTSGTVATMAVIATGPNAVLPPSQFVSISAGNGTLAAGNMEGAAWCNLASSGATAMTTRTAAQILAQIPNGQIGMNYMLAVFNSNAGTLTLTGGTGVTITGTATLATNTARLYNVAITGAAALTMQNMGTYTGT